MCATFFLVSLLVSELTISKMTARLAISTAAFDSAHLQLPGGFLIDRYANNRLRLAGTLIFAPVAVLGMIIDTITSSSRRMSSPVSSWSRRRIRTP